MDEMVAIPKDEYDTLKRYAAELYALEEAGVDNWEGYEYAMEILAEED